MKNDDFCIKFDETYDSNIRQSGQTQQEKPHTLMTSKAHNFTRHQGRDQLHPKGVAHEFTTGLRDPLSTKDPKLCFDSECQNHIFQQFVSSVP